MTKEELIKLLDDIHQVRCETSTLEIKAAAKGCPQKLYGTLSSFSNQDEGGIIVFGVDENQNYKEVGVYDAQDLQKKVNEQALQMEPIVRPLMTVAEKDGNVFVSAEIPGIDISERPCYYRGQGRMKGSFVRIGDSDEPMTEYEIYSYEAFRKRYQDEIRGAARVTLSSLEQSALDRYVDNLKQGKPNLAKLEDKSILDLMGVTGAGCVTLSATLLFSPYPQAYFPQLCITAVSVPGKEIGDLGAGGERFIDNKRIEGNIENMLEDAIQFVRKNMRTKTIINPETGKREDVPDYPITAVREALLNALVHRDYSIHTEGMPIQLRMFEDRMEIHNPGGIYGRIKADQLGKVQPDTRNPVLAGALEVMGITENRYSGVPTIRKVMEESGLPEPIFEDKRGSFVVTFTKKSDGVISGAITSDGVISGAITSDGVTSDGVISNGVTSGAEFRHTKKDLVEFCETPRCREEICEYLGLKSTSYAMKEYVQPLIDSDILKMTIPEKPKSSKQRYFSAQ